MTGEEFIQSFPIRHRRAASALLNLYSYFTDHDIDLIVALGGSQRVMSLSSFDSNGTSDIERRQGAKKLLNAILSDVSESVAPFQDIFAEMQQDSEREDNGNAGV